MNPTTGAKKKVRSTQYQLGLLVEQLEANTPLACGIFTGPMGHQRQEAQWDEVAKKLSEFGPEKTAKQCKSSWRDLKRKCRIKNASINEGRQRTGNNVNVPQLTELELKVLKIIGPQSSVGVGEDESGLEGEENTHEVEPAPAMVPDLSNPFEVDIIESQCQPRLDSETVVIEQIPVLHQGGSKRPMDAPTSTKQARKKMDFLDMEDIATRYANLQENNNTAFTDIASSLNRLASAHAEFAEATKQHNKIEEKKNKIKIFQMKMLMMGSQDEDMQNELDNLDKLC